MKSFHSFIKEYVMIDNAFLNSVIPFQYKAQPDGNIVKVTAQVQDRIAGRQTIADNLTSKNVPHKEGVKASSSIEGFKTIDAQYNGTTYRIYVKPMRQSGAGAETTALGESFQAYACSARRVKGRALESPDEVFEIPNSDKYADCDRTLKQTRELASNWQYTGYVTANKINDFLVSSKTYTFHRGGKFVKALEDEFLFHKKNEDIPIRDINKWTPADIWASSSTFQMPGRFASLTHYNQFLLDNFKSKDLVGISLKVLEPGKLPNEEIYNSDTVISRVNLVGFQTTTTAKDIYIQFTNNRKPGKMQLRTFVEGMSSWQGEIKGGAAAGGKVSGGPIEAFMRLAGITNFVTAEQAKRLVLDRNKITTEFIKFGKVVAPNITQSQIINMLSTHNNSWVYSKFLGWQFCYILNSVNVPGKENKLLANIVGYASSSTSYSAVFVKYS